MSSTQTMRAVNYQGAFSVKVEDVPKPTIEHPDDVVVKVTTAAICGSDLHMYEGRTGAQAGITFGMLMFRGPQENIKSVLIDWCVCDRPREHGYR